MSAPLPLALPINYNPATAMIARTEDTGVFHASRLGAELARALVANGTEADLILATRTLAAVLSCQETREGDPHRGNFRWEMEDAGVEDLNAVHFVLIDLLPMMARHEERLPGEARAALRAAVRLALDEIARIDVGLDYTNIALKDIANTLLGAEVLGCERSLARGREKFAAWLELTASAGGVFELNSPAYTPIALRVLHELAEHTRDRATAVRARTAAARLGLTYALRLVPATGRLAGPYCRAYRHQVLGDAGPERARFHSMVQRGVLPQWLRHAVGALPLPGELVERYDATRGYVYATWLDREFAMGTATRELDSQANRYIAGQSNVFTLHFAGRGERPEGVAFTRYILDEKWLGDFRTTPARTSRELLLDEGRFFGVQDGARAIGVYAPRQLGAWEVCRGAKLVFVVSRRAAVDEVLLDGERVDVSEVPRNCRDGATIVFGCGAAWLGIRVLARTDLGRDAPIQIVERDGDLLLEIYNYLGPAKTFWELATPGSFYAGQPCCGFLAEVIARTEQPSGEVFSSELARGNLCDAPPLANDRASRCDKRVWSIEYERAGKRLGLAVDLNRWALERRWTERGTLAHEPLESTVARQGVDSGQVEAAGATFRFGAGSGWIFGNPTARIWAAGGHAREATTFTLSTPDGDLQGAGVQTGTLIVSPTAMHRECC